MLAAERVFRDPTTVQLAERVQSGDLDGVRRMLAAGAKVDEVGTGGLTLPHMALLAKSNGPQVMSLLLEAGADPISLLADGESVPQYAASRDNAPPEMMIVLLTHGVSPNWFPSNGASKELSLLQGAITGANLPIVKLLVQYGADINYVDPVSGSALHFALSSTDFAIAAFLVDAGIDLNLLNRTAPEFLGTKVVPQTALEQFCVEEGGKRGHNPLPEVAAGWRAFTAALAKRGVAMPCDL